MNKRSVIKTDIIPLSLVLPLDRPNDFKAHFAVWNQYDQPMDVLGRSFDEWRGWQEFRPTKNDFNRPYIFSLAKDYRYNDRWLFGGIWEVSNRHPDRYEVQLCDLGKPYIKRLVLRRDFKQRQIRTKMESHYDAFEVVEILGEPYAGLPFTGYENINLTFAELETIVRNNQPDWNIALSHAKGVYLITDTLTGKIYVGSAYGQSGLWSRWNDYVNTGHGGNVELRNIVTDPSLDYCRKHFRFSLLEMAPSGEADDNIIRREMHWKNVLGSKGELGLNRN